MNLFRKIAGGVLMAILMPQVVSAQVDLKDVEGYLDADFVSHYMWRGLDRAGISIQPTAYVSYQGLTLKMDGSTGLRRDDIQEIVFTLGYENTGFNIGVTDYWMSGLDAHDRFFYYGKDGGHQIEGNIGYSWKYGSIQAYTMFACNDFKYSGDRAFSTYVELGVPFKLGGLNWRVAAGVTPFESGCTVETYTDKTTGKAAKRTTYTYAEGFACVMASIRATKTLDLGFSNMPVFAEFHTNPYLQTANVVFGVTICPFSGR